MTYPNDVGVPLYEDVGDMYVMMEMHYDNSQFQKGMYSFRYAPSSPYASHATAGVVDSSGMRVWITEQLRQYDADQAMIGIDVGAAEQVIPPGVSEFTNYAYCSADCTSGFPKTGVKVIGGLMHTHLAGTFLHAVACVAVVAMMEVFQAEKSGCYIFEMVNNCHI